MPYYDDEMTDRAVEAHRRWALKQPGYIYDQPNRSETFRDGNMIYIAAYRFLARYRVIQTADGTERLRRLFPVKRRSTFPLEERRAALDELKRELDEEMREFSRSRNDRCAT